MKINFFLILISIVFLLSCTKDKKPIEGSGLLNDLITNEITNVQTKSATTGGTINSTGIIDINTKGVCWSTTPNPTINSSNVVSGTGNGSFVAVITGLLPSTTYYLRAYATTSLITYYGDAKTFKTKDVVLPTVSQTFNASLISQDTAISGGSIVDDGGGTISSRGVCWTTNPPATIANAHSSDGGGTGTFASTLKNLTANTTYFVRAFAINEAGTSYGPGIQFNTLSLTAPIVSLTSAATVISYISATSGGTVISSGGSTIVSKGICWSTTPNPTTNNSKTNDGSGLGTFASSMNNLTPGTTYYIRAYATNSIGIGYGPQVQFTTLALASPTIGSTNAISNITQTTASSGGNISSDGGASVTAKGICWSTIQNPTIFNAKSNDGSGIGVYTSQLTGLTPATTYYIRSYATNSIGTAYGNQLQFTTLSYLIPTVSLTNSITGITKNSAISGGNISSDGGSPITSKGVCWSTSPNPSIANSKTNDGAGVGSFISNLIGLNPSTYYYVCAYATNLIGTAYGPVVNFTSSFSPLAIGDNYQGGKIAYIFQPGDPGYNSNIPHGLIISTTDLLVSQWGCFGAYSNASSSGIGTGVSNTSNILNYCSTSNIAARVCSNANIGGYSDWYLPSKDELNLVYLNKSQLGTFTNTYYWTSTEISSTNAWAQLFSNGAQILLTKNTGVSVRPMRTF